jgi:hypothetical protein
MGGYFRFRLDPAVASFSEYPMLASPALMTPAVVAAVGVFLISRRFFQAVNEQLECFFF